MNTATESSDMRIADISGCNNLASQSYGLRAADWVDGKLEVQPHTNIPSIAAQIHFKDSFIPQSKVAFIDRNFPKIHIQPVHNEIECQQIRLREKRFLGNMMKKFLPLALIALAVSMMFASCTMNHACSAYADTELVSEQ